MIIVKVEGQLLSADSKAYDVNGNKGVSHRARFLIESEIFSLKTTPESIEELKDHVDESFPIEVGFDSRKENLTAQLVRYEI